MTEKEEQALQLFEKFIYHCEKYNVWPQYIMTQYLSEDFYQKLQNFWKFYHYNNNTD